MKRVILFCVVVVTLFTLVACTPTTTTSEGTTSEVSAVETEQASVGETEKISIGVDYATSDKWNLEVYNAVKATGDVEGWTVFGAEGQRDPAKTLSNIDSFVTKNADYILVVGVDLSLEKSVQEKCDALGIPVAFAAVGNDPGFTVIAGAGSQYDIATQISTYLAQKAIELWDGQVDLAVVTTNLAMGESGQEIIDACADVWSESLGINKEDLFIVDCPWDNLKASELFTSMLTAHPDAQHILAYSFVDLHHGVPLFNAAKAAGRLEQLIMGGTNTADESTPTLMIEAPNTWVCQLTMGGDISGNLYAELVKAAIEGTPMEAKVYMPNVDLPLATPEDIANYY